MHDRIHEVKRKTTRRMPSKPVGSGSSPILRTLAMPADTNPNGDVFGGWIMSQMDIAGGILAKETARSRMVTVAVDSFKFLRPVKVGDVVCCYGRVLRIGTTSITIALEVWVKKVLPGIEEASPRFKVTEAIFTYVAIDGAGKKRRIRVESSPREIPRRLRK
jgi:acyl-CoA thioesterase YciA